MEDIGGPSGYAEFLEAIKDPSHERHEEFEAWAGGNYDPNKVDERRIEANLETLAKLWTPKPKAKRPRK